jgi:hypothetical protein
VYLTYSLIMRLAAAKRTCLLRSPLNRYVFTEFGVDSVPLSALTVVQHLQKYACKDALTLYDLGADHPTVSLDLSYNWRTIVASSPKPSRYSSWIKQVRSQDDDRGVDKFVMKSWSWEEIYLSRQVGGFQLVTSVLTSATVTWPTNLKSIGLRAILRPGWMRLICMVDLPGVSLPPGPQLLKRKLKKPQRALTSLECSDSRRKAWIMPQVTAS